jgi:hypothetical protein
MAAFAPLVPSPLLTEVKMLELLAWCDRDTFIDYLDRHLLHPNVPTVSLFCVADHVDNCARALMMRISQQLAENEQRAPKKIKPNRLIHIERAWECTTADAVSHAICDAIAVNSDAELLQKLGGENLALHLVCAYFNVSNLPDREVSKGLKAVSEWVDAANRVPRSPPCKLMLVLVLQYGDKVLKQNDTIWSRFSKKATPLERIQNTFAQERKKGSLSAARIDELLILKPYEAKDFRSWIGMKRVREVLGEKVVKDLANEYVIAELFKDGTCSFTQLLAILEQRGH